MRNLSQKPAPFLEIGWFHLPFVVLLLLPTQSCLEMAESGGLFTCSGSCIIALYNDCTCDPGDPCGWIGDGFCDVTYCAASTDTYFDDDADCGNSAECAGNCGRGMYNSCTCGSDDPCNWVNDGTCDEDVCASTAPDGYFDDSADCTGAGGTCSGDCASRRYSRCTCGTDDPCGWANDGSCDQWACTEATDSVFDDSADCGSVVSGDNSFGVTAVRDDLDNQDMDIMASGLQSLGYAAAVRDTNVTTSSLSGYLTQTLSLLYHTGHGLDGAVQTSDGMLTVPQVSINVTTTIWATCLTLVEDWSSAFESTAHEVLGYTMVSYDFVDNDVVTAFVSALGSGSSPISAWYQANNANYNVSDRWAGYVREGGSIVEYSARTGNTPSGPFDVANQDLVQFGRAGNLWIAEHVLDDERVFSLSQASVLVDDGEHTSAMLPGGWERLAPTRMSREEAIGVAEEYVDARLGGLGADVMLERVIELTVRREGELPATIGYSVRWSRQVAGLPVRGNRTADHVSVLVGPDGVAGWSRYWPELEQVPATVYWGELLTVGEATRLAADDIARSAKGEIDLVDARIVYGTLGPNSRQPMLVPAYELESLDGSRIVIDAFTGRLLR